mmetsp:Transcript_69645/g.209081  ORF Transcript_69645/g.209081 Transcript_69645/m.209081 type:complete len:111 (-) Transcript_69645:399-731(-)
MRAPSRPSARRRQRRSSRKCVQAAARSFQRWPHDLRRTSSCPRLPTRSRLLLRAIYRSMYECQIDFMLLYEENDGQITALADVPVDTTTKQLMRSMYQGLRDATHDQHAG